MMNCQEEDCETEMGKKTEGKSKRNDSVSAERNRRKNTCRLKSSEMTQHQTLPLTVCRPRQAAPARTPSAERWFVAEAQTWRLWSFVFPLQLTGDP